MSTTTRTEYELDAQARELDRPTAGKLSSDGASVGHAWSSGVIKPPAEARILAVVAIGKGRERRRAQASRPSNSQLGCPHRSAGCQDKRSRWTRRMPYAEGGWGRAIAMPQPLHPTQHLMGRLMTQFGGVERVRSGLLPFAGGEQNHQGTNGN
jgi:hypothetical protein